MADGAAIDQVISLRFPSYAVRHPKHVCWLNHTMREYYDLWDAVQRDALAEGLDQGTRPSPGDAPRGSISARAQRVEAVRAVRRRSDDGCAMWPEVKSQVLYPPAPQRELPLRRIRRLHLHGLASDAA